MTTSITNGKTQLEKIGQEARMTALLRNEWRKDLEYSKPLVDAEYLIQTEFKVSSYEDRLAEAKAKTDARQEKRQARRKERRENRQAKRKEKL